MTYPHILLALLVAIFWGFNFVVIKIGLSEMPPFTFIFLRYVFASLPLIFFVKRPRIPIKLLITIGLTIGFIKFSFLFMGMYLGVNAGLSSLMLQSQAFFTIILSFLLFNHRLTRAQAAGIIVAFSGIAFIGIQMHLEASLLGLICILCAALSWSTSNILVNKAGPLDSFALIVWTSLVPPLPILGMVYLFEGGNEAFIKVWQNLNWTSATCTLYISWIATLIGGTLWAKLMKLYSPCLVAPYSLLIPIFAFLSSWLVLGETISFPIMAGCIVVFIGLGINQWHSRNKPILITYNLIKTTIKNKIAA
jgi:O-acetylserine/cysteine efflux transporter